MRKLTSAQAARIGRKGRGVPKTLTDKERQRRSAWMRRVSLNRLRAIRRAKRQAAKPARTLAAA